MNILLFVLMIAVVMLLWLVEVKLGVKALMGRNAGARVSGPLFSMSASGTIGKAITYGTWKGRPWARVWFKPHNPKSTNQVNVRTALKILVALWQSWEQSSHDTWDTFAEGTGKSGFNQMVGRGMLEYVSQLTTAVTPLSALCAGTPPGENWTWNPVV